ncbi:MAG: glutaminyl-peptide cyclotransferase [Gammaproteobacteria bacterium]|nr:glutaminyl-peptide cyclotransferase [Gammaproteobacteria bacterium]
MNKTHSNLLHLVLGFRNRVIVLAVLALGFPRIVTTSSSLERSFVNQRAPTHGYEVVRVYPHDRNAFTQGLTYVDGFLYESTGVNGRSTLRKVEIETGKVLRQTALSREHFGEGLTSWGPDLVQLTWTSNLGFLYDRMNFQVKRTFNYSGSGWGITHDGKRLIMSDGTATLRFLDATTSRETGRQTVRDGTTAVTQLNELETVRGELYANVWKTDRIARIALQTGQVTDWIDLRGLLSEADKAIGVDVLNGIAYDARNDRLFVTGKLWPKLFEIKLVPRR